MRRRHKTARCAPTYLASYACYSWTKGDATVTGSTSRSSATTETRKWWTMCRRYSQNTTVLTAAKTFCGFCRFWTDAGKSYTTGCYTGFSFGAASSTNCLWRGATGRSHFCRSAGSTCRSSRSSSRGTSRRWRTFTHFWRHFTVTNFGLTTWRSS